MSRFLVTGSRGQVGSELRVLCLNYQNHEFTFTDRSILDLSNLESISVYLSENKFDVIINCAGYTVVDKAESEPELADLVNHQAVAMLATIAKNQNIILIHISTDYVFDGKSDSPYLESDLTNPINIYGKTKRAGEEAILRIAPPSSIIIRTSWIYSNFGNNFVKTMLKIGRESESLDVIFDQTGSPTYARDLAQMILNIVPQVKNTTPEIYHYSNEGAISWYEFAKAIFEISNIDCRVDAIEAKNYQTSAPSPAKRPLYSVLNKSKIKNDFGLSLPYWKDSLVECLKIILK